MNANTARARAREHEHLHAFISLSQEAGEGPAVAVKDLVDVRGMVTTGGGRLLPAVPAERDAPVVTRIRESGAVVMGKANLHEWAFGATSDNPHHGAVLNPNDQTRVAGGSSGGSAVAVAMGMCDWALGSDTGGSIRIPAAFCGVTGIKPTYGSITTVGVIPLARTFDTLGPLAPDVRSAALALESMSELGTLLPAAARHLTAFRLGVPRGWVEDLDAPTAVAWERVRAEHREIDVPARSSLHDPGVTILLVEAAEVHRAWFEMHPELYGSDTAALLAAGLRVSRADYVAALVAQAAGRGATEAAMDAAGVDALLLPVVPFVAPRLGEAVPRGRLLSLTRPFNVTGQPVVALPAPVAAGSLPVGMQLVGRAGRERELVEVALAVEAAWAQAD